MHLSGELLDGYKIMYIAFELTRAAALFVVPKEVERVAQKLQYFFRDGIDGEKLGITVYFATDIVFERSC